MSPARTASVIRVTAQSHPALHAAMALVEIDNGAHLIGTIYPGPSVDLDCFLVPSALAPQVDAAEKGLARLRAEMPAEAFETFVSGDMDEAAELVRSRGDLDAARELLDAWFSGWPGHGSALLARVAELEGLLNTPELHDFAKAVVLEAAHQRERWGSDHDAGKMPADWFFLIGYLGGKALHAQINGNKEKALHHVITTAAACANWHAAISGDSETGADDTALAGALS